MVCKWLALGRNAYPLIQCSNEDASNEERLIFKMVHAVAYCIGSFIIIQEKLTLLKRGNFTCLFQDEMIYP